MKNIYESNPENIQNAITVLKNGGNVVMPTETVYGLAGIGNNDKSIAQIYEIKNRPQFNPLIAHCYDINMIEKIAVLNDMAKNILNHFTDGGITIILPIKSESNMSKLACAGLKTVAVRIPNHKDALAIIKGCGFPIFAPSANASGEISPTRPEHVYKSLGDNVEMIIDGGKCAVGIESTIIDLSSDEPAILRAGATTQSELEKFTGLSFVEKTFAKGNNPIAPGQLKSHYKPNKPLFINVSEAKSNQAFLSYGKDVDCFFNLSENSDLLEIASNLFESLHKADESEYNEIAISTIPENGIGVAINDKLTRGSK